MNESNDQRFAALGTGISCAILLITSIIFITGGLQLGLGSPFRLGTGAFPFITGLLLSALTIAIFIAGLKEKSEQSDPPDWMSFLAISASLAVFASSADRLGLIPAVFLTVVVASSPDKQLSWNGKLLLGAVVSAGCWVLFIELLNLPLKAITGI